MTARRYTGRGAIPGKEFVTDARTRMPLPDGVIGARLTDAEIGEIVAAEVRREGYEVKSVTCFAAQAEVETGVIRDPERASAALARAELRVNVLAPRAALDAWNMAVAPTRWERFSAWVRRVWRRV